MNRLTRIRPAKFHPNPADNQWMKIRVNGSIRATGRRPMSEDTPGRYGARPFSDREMLGAFAFLVLFGLPFAAGGTWALVQAAVKLARGELRDGLMLGAMGTVFALVGFGLIAGSLWARGKVSVDAAAAFAHPDEPWKWRADWARGYGVDGGP